MILPCRIHQPAQRLDLLALALLVAVALMTPCKAISQETSASLFEGGGIGWLPAIPIQLTAGLDVGYDGNATLSPSAKGSSFVGENIVLTYTRPTEPTQFFLLGIGRFDQYFNVSRNDVDENVTMSLSHNFSTRVSFYTSIFAAYQSQPNFQSNVGPENVVQDHFYTTDIFSLTYHWSTRFSMITSYTFDRVKYFSSSNGNSQNGVQNTSDQNRIQNTFGEEFRFSLTRRTVLVGEYRFEAIDYDTAPLNSTTNFVFAGINHNLTEHLMVHVRGGESFRSLENEGNMASPYFESTVDYTSSNHTLSWTSSYEFESPTAPGATTTKTLRTGLRLTYDLTSRLSSTTGVYYHHDENTGGTGSGSQNSFDLTASLRYLINKHFTLNLDYNHTTLGSVGSTPGYSRNSCSGGVTYIY